MESDNEEDHGRTQNGNSVQDDDEEYTVSPRRLRSRTKKSPSKTVIEEPMSYRKAVKVIKRIKTGLLSEDVTIGKARKQRTAVKLKVKEWDEICTAVEQKAFQDGLPDEVLESIWNLVATRSYPLADRHSAKLVLSMVPTEDRIPGDRIHDIISHVVGFQPETKLAVYMYLTGVYDYNLCHKSVFSEEDSYGRIFLQGQAQAVIPWMCALLKRISTPELIFKSHVSSLIGLALKPAVPPAALKALVDLLRFIKILRPELVPRRIQNFPIGDSKNVRFSEVFQEGLYRARRRFMAIASDDEASDREPAPNTIVERVTKSRLLLNTLREQSFPEFMIVRDDDPPLDDYAAILRLSKYDQMRCFLRTTETLPFIVYDPQLTRCFSNTITLLLQHKFGHYRQKDDARYSFILRRIWELSTIGRTGIPAVSYWILEFMRTWDGLLFKPVIYGILSWLPPTQFTDGYLHVLQKLERFFLYGPAGDRYQVWVTLKKLASDWILQLDEAEQDQVDGMDRLKEAVQYLFGFIDSLVIQLAAIGGHNDHPFLVYCCETYLELNASVKAMTSSPFYVFPPIQLWAMVVLSDSLKVIDSFCKFLHRHEPRQRWAHLKNPVQKQKWDQWTKLYRDTWSYFVVPGQSTLGPVLLPVFTAEIDSLGDAIDTETDPRTGQVSTVGSALQETEGGIVQQLSTFRALTSSAFEPILLKVKYRGKTLVDSIDPDKGEELGPNVLKWLATLGSIIVNHGKQTRITVVKKN